MYAQVATNVKQSMGLAPVADTVSYSFMINIATDVPPTTDVTVTLKVDTAAVAAYQAAHTSDSANYKPYPTVKILNPTVIIPKGTRVGYVNVIVWGADALDACSNFIAAISIDQVSNNIPIAGNMKSYLMSLPISNPYAGDYHVVGYRKHPSAGILPVDKIETASTVNCSTIIKTGFGDYPYQMSIKVTSNTITVLGDVCYQCIVTVIDPSTGAPVASGQGMYNTFTGSAATTPVPPTNDVNYYDPVKKIFVLNAYYNTNAPRIAYEILTRQ